MTGHQEYSRSGSRICRHEPREHDFTPAGAGSEDLDRIVDHLENHLGKPDFVFHEMVSHLVHVDVHHIPPGEDREFHTLVTTGMSDKPMLVPPGAEEFQYAELVLYLPADWPLGDPARVGSTGEDMGNLWPAQWLKFLARFPHAFETWLGHGHTLANGDPPGPLGPGTRLCGSLLLPPVLAPEGFTPLRLGPEKTVHFWWPMPVYQEEMQYKLDKGLDALLRRFDRASISPLLDISRPNVCSIRFGLS